MFRPDWCAILSLDLERFLQWKSIEAGTRAFHLAHTLATATLIHVEELLCFSYGLNRKCFWPGSTGIFLRRVYADDVNILVGSIYNIKKNTEALVVASKEIGLEVNAEKTKYMVMSRD
jgi:hypothetical protein